MKFIDLYLHDKFQHYHLRSVLGKGVNFMASKLKNLSSKNKKMEMEQFPILKEFEVLFCDKISVLPHK